MAERQTGLPPEQENIVLIGMPSSGKTTVGAMLAAALGRPLINIDEEIERREGRSIPDIFAEIGETGFRDIESRVTADVAERTGTVLATGGGVILREENLRALRKYGRLYFLDRPLEELHPSDDRPLSRTEDALRQRFEERYERYLAAADVRIDDSGRAENATEAVRADYLRRAGTAKYAVRIRPGRAFGTVAAPPGKSMTHRLLLCAALSGGPCRIRGVVPSGDVLATLEALPSLGAGCSAEDGAVLICRGDRPGPGTPVFCRESASTLRFLIPLLLLGDEEYVLTGSPRLMERPLGPYADLCAEQGLTFRKDGTSLHVRGPLRSGTFTLPGSVSSQFVSGLLFALPLLDGDSKIVLTGGVSSRAYIEMTRQIQSRFGVRSGWTDEAALSVPGKQTYLPADGAADGDWSAGSVLEGLNLLGGDVTVTGLDPESLHADRMSRQYYPLLLSGCPTLDVDQCPDLAPALMALAAAHRGAVLTGTARLRAKESDRPAAMAAELRKLGVSCRVEENAVFVEGGTLHASETPLDSHNDHRVAMALSLLLTKTGGVLEGAEAVAKSWPDYFNVLRRLHVSVETV